MKQRPIKFRAWHTDEYPVKELRETMLPHDQLSLDGCLDGVTHGNIILMEFTGLTDAKGTEVYEGDIIEVQYVEEGKIVSIYNEIAFQDGCFGLMGEINRTVFYPFQEGDLKDSVVIGTVFTHGHLVAPDRQEDDTSVWDASRYVGINDVKPIFAKVGNLTNWLDWEQAFRAAMGVDRYVQTEVDKVDWVYMRTTYFNEFISALEAFEDHFYFKPISDQWKN